MAVLEIQGKFNEHIFNDLVQQDLLKLPPGCSPFYPEEEKLEVGIYQQFDTNNGRKHTVITITGPERVYGKVFDLEDKVVGFEDNEHTKITFKGTSLKEWLSKVGAVEERGATFGINMGPFPRAPNDSTIQKLAPLLKMYGKMTHVIYYADHSTPSPWASSWATSLCPCSASPSRSLTAVSTRASLS